MTTFDDEERDDFGPPAGPTPEQIKLKEYLEKGQTKRFMMSGAITPRMARAMILQNTNNRPLAPQRVEMLRNEIEAGRWKETHQGIAFNKDGDLLDGQHRLAAIIAAGKSVFMTATFGLEDSAVLAIDTGKTRSNGDILGLNGYMDGARLAAAARLAMQLEAIWNNNGKAVGKAFRPTPAMIAAWVKANPDMVGCVKVGIDFQNAMKRGGTGAAAASAFFMLKATDMATVTKFFTKVTSGIGVHSEDDPIYHLRKHMIANQRFEGLTLAAYLIKAFNSWVNGKPMHKLFIRETIPRIEVD